jgi:dihydroneopterin aldolase
VTKLLARVANATEAKAAIKGGADLIEVASSGEARDAESAERYVWTAIGGVPAAGDARAIAVMQAGAAPDLEAIDALAGRGFAGALLEADAARLLDLVPVADIARFVERCRARGLEAWLAGALEAPDVPRLLALRPDVLCFDEALRGASGKLDASRLAILRDLIPRAGAAQIPSPDCAPGPRDKLFVHDLVLAISVGAYAQEREKRQRVRFNVDVEIARPSAEARDMRDVFSYDLIADTIRRVASKGHVELLETLAERIARDLLGHPAIARLTLRLEKLDVGPAIVGIEIVRDRG